jgi:hypothetical protein
MTMTTETRPKRDTLLSVWVSQAQAAQIEKMANQEELSMSAFVRSLLARRLREQSAA